MFVYGTLRPPGAEPTHTIVGWQLFNHYDRFPYIKPGYKTSTVYGNVIEVTAAQLKQLDHIEGVAHELFHREVVEVREIADASCSEAFVYVAGNIAPQPIQSGDWFNRE